MFAETKKLRIIQEVLKIKNESILTALENFLEKSIKKEPTINPTEFAEFSGIWSEKEAAEIERIIEESCETIHPDDWK